ncbi:UPF0042 nucleotide-binding protein [Sphingomonas gellani]|uniref:UPF0042 nucleotide-binding protein n=1 Tax=Sphingomonas gellani TaxID=1166340 RepID=A0A1H7ZUZ7_9SPHN|nr:RNase adapter RapZ [Sphingomonas gellani]SEM61398.1 UPF0042 nucleotide-binding protein [Sphingomonas gellani]
MQPPDILLVTGLSGAGRVTVLKTLEDQGWEVVDNLPLGLIDQLLRATPPDAGSGTASKRIAIGLGSRTRDFDTTSIIAHVRELERSTGLDIGTLFLDCATEEIERRYSETRRRHPLAPDRPVADGIAREREMLQPLRDWADRLIDTTDLKANQLAQLVRDGFGGGRASTLSVMSFGFSRGLPRNADLVFDMRFLRNPHWVAELRPRTGLDPSVAAYIIEDPAYEPAISRIEDLLALLLPRYQAEGKAYVTVAIGCTGGKHRSVHVADRIAAWLRRKGFSPTMTHRDLVAQAPSLEGTPAGR